MTLSSPPPANSTWRWYVQRTAIVSRFVAGLLVTFVSVRFAIAGLEHAMGVSAANFSEKPAPHTGDVSPLPSSSNAPRSASPAPPASTAPLIASGRPLRITLSVTAGSARSEVYVNGRLVGQTPFLGDTSCKAGLPVRIELIPDKGPPLTYQRECRRGTIEISGPPP